MAANLSLKFIIFPFELIGLFDVFASLSYRLLLTYVVISSWLIKLSLICLLEVSGLAIVAV